jgi:hypothetical protein
LGYEEGSEMMKIVCAWCNIIIQEGPEYPMSHGICPECGKKILMGIGVYREKEVEEMLKSPQRHSTNMTYDILLNKKGRGKE